MKKLIALLLTLIMAFVISAVPVFAGGDMVGSYIKIGDDIKRPIDKNDSGSGWVYDENCILTLNNYNGGTIYFYSNYETRKNLTIVLNGTNTVNGNITSGDANDGYGQIFITGEGTLSANRLSGGRFIISASEVTVNMNYGEDHFVFVNNDKITVKKGAVLNINEDNSGGSLSRGKLIAEGGTINISNAQESFFCGKENLTITDGGKITVHSSYYSGAVLCRYDSTAPSEYLVTDKNGFRAQLEEQKFSNPSGHFVSSSNPEAPLFDVMITEYVIKSKAEHIVDEWAKADIDAVIDEKLMPACLGGADLREDINRAEFAEAAVMLYEKMSGSELSAETLPFNDLGNVGVMVKESIGKAYAAGLMNGISDTEFSPEASLTREQASTILFRIYTKLGGKVGETVSTFADDASISSWAKEAVYFMADREIVKGVGEGMFAPQNNTQAQQALVIALRMFKNLK